MTDGSRQKSQPRLRYEHKEDYGYISFFGE
jgi:hypothetical protein